MLLFNGKNYKTTTKFIGKGSIQLSQIINNKNKEKK